MVPEVVVQGLVDRIVRIKGLLDAVTAITVAATPAAIGLALVLTCRLRDDEMRAAVRLGAGRGMVLRLMLGEALILLAGAGWSRLDRWASSPYGRKTSSTGSWPSGPASMERVR